MNPIRRTRALVGALALTLALAGPTLGATATQSASETLTVNSTLTLTGVPATLAYGSGVGGATLSAPAFTAVSTTNNPAGVVVSATVNALTSNGNTIALTNRSVLLAQGTSWTGCSEMSGNALPFTKTFTAASMNLYQRTTAGTCEAVVTPKVTIPASAVPGAYTGTFTLTATES